MDRTWYTRLGVILAVTFGTLWMLVPTYYSFFRLDRDTAADRPAAPRAPAVRTNAPAPRRLQTPAFAAAQGPDEANFTHF